MIESVFELMNFYSLFEENRSQIKLCRSSKESASQVSARFWKSGTQNADHYQESIMASKAIQCNYVLSRNQELESEQYQASSNDRQDA